MDLKIDRACSHWSLAFSKSCEQEIGGLVYYLYLKNKKDKIDNLNEIKENIYIKISNLLPQDIIVILPDENPIKKKYYEKKKYKNFKQYIEYIHLAILLI